MEVRQLPSTQALEAKLSRMSYPVAKDHEAMLRSVGKLTVTDVAKISFFFCFVVRLSTCDATRWTHFVSVWILKKLSVQWLKNTKWNAISLWYNFVFSFIDPFTGKVSPPNSYIEWWEKVFGHLVHLRCTVLCKQSVFSLRVQFISVQPPAFAYVRVHCSVRLRTGCFGKVTCLATHPDCISSPFVCIPLMQSKPFGKFSGIYLMKITQIE